MRTCGRLWQYGKLFSGILSTHKASPSIQNQKERTSSCLSHAHLWPAFPKWYSPDKRPKTAVQPDGGCQTERRYSHIHCERNKPNRQVRPKYRQFAERRQYLEYLFTQLIIEVIQEHQHGAAHDHKHTNHDRGDVNDLLVLLLSTVVPFVLHVASGGTQMWVYLNKFCRLLALLLINIATCALTMPQFLLFNVPAASPISSDSHCAHCHQKDKHHVVVHHRFIGRIHGHLTFLPKRLETEVTEKEIPLKD